ncbi:hypothetical protein ABI_35530 [Asticcacaulis biprosthecium C19]|uniref:Uncharacterized protein n=1 Tax=Asticcacaulis biprosthecium C19 TaxID=715226 RepID=F4QQP3_9CAUL|nr:hypothetical protein [Asticcacaulis biprosthecium]EGF90530.1 hypothetical protein ABI_35530 [Asticcacaulis biprosthecium C19]
MVLKDNLGIAARTVFFLIGLLLLVVVVATIYHDWPLVQAHKSSLFGFVLTCLICLPLGILILVWAVIGHMKTWRIATDGVHMRQMSLTHWAHENILEPAEIADIQVESFNHDEHGRKSAHWVMITTTDGRRHKSPRVYDPMVAEVMRSRIAALKPGVADISAFTP